MPSDTREPEDLSVEALRQITEIIISGEAMRPDGTIFKPDSRDIAGLLKWAAALSPQKRRTVPRPEDFQVGLPQEKGDAKRAEHPVGGKVEGPANPV